ncbi:MAG: membrane protein insertase YidC [Alphaproteobacteria bacterium]|nr:membrane protein insertase YidC [Alphaproteobacteria bacterium]
MKEDLKSFYLAVLLSMAVVFVANQWIFGDKNVENAESAAIEEASVLQAENESASAKEENTFLAVDDVLRASPRVDILNNDLQGSIRLVGGRIDNIKLRRYKQSLEKASPDVELFAPAKTKNPYYAEFGWLSNDKNLKLPNSETLWSLRGTKLTPKTPVILEWDNGEGLRFVTKFSLDDNYMFVVEQAVENNTAEKVTLFPYGMIVRSPEEVSRSIVHEGLIGVFDDKLEEIEYSDLSKESKEFKANKGWFGFSDRYWFSSIIFGNKQPVRVKFSQNNERTYQADFVGDAVEVASGSVASVRDMMYIGAKEIKLLDNYAKNLNINKFDLAVDFGWYYFLTKPFFYILDYLYKLIGNMGWAILLFAALLRLFMFPIANKSYENMAKMKKLQPKMKELQEKYAGDKLKLQQETMLLYQKEKINPASGCLPMFIQIPVFFSLYKVLNIAIEIRQAPFVGWIKDLSAPDPLVISQWSHLPMPAFLDIGIWPIVMGITMYIQQKMNPAPTNKDQARAFALMPLIFMFMMGHFASGLVIYWSFSNLLSIIQQRAIIVKNRDK